MNTLYWITVLGNLNTLLIITVIISMSITVLMGIGCLCEQDKKVKLCILKIFKVGSLLTSVSEIMLVFIPPTNQLYAIYGVGTVIDYAKGSKEVQKLPDNAVKALNVLLENVNKDKKDSTNITK